jgi:sulfatase modifying factor 1
MQVTTNGMRTHDLVAIPAGAFTRGTAPADLDAIAAAQHLPRTWFEDESPAQRVSVEAFRIDRHQVTNAQFAQFTEATGYRTVAERRGFGLTYGEEFWEHTPGACWRQPTGPHGPSASDWRDHPVVHIAWPDADAYAAWAGLRLPTELEWEYAARGMQARTWPWGDTWDPTVANTAERTNRGQRITDMASWRAWWLSYRREYPLPGTTPVGSFPEGDSPFGVSDMAGNVMEWTAETYRPYDPTRSYGDLYDAAAGRYKVNRGGGWMNYRFQVRGGERMAADPIQYSNYCVGFRCAADV